MTRHAAMTLLIVGVAVMCALAVAAVALLAPAALPAAADGGRPIALVYQGVDPRVADRNAIFVADARGEQRRQILASVDGDLTHPDWSPDGRALLFVVDGAAIWTSTARGHRATRIVAVPTGADYPAWSPDGRSIAYTRYGPPAAAGPPSSSRIVVRDLRSGKERTVAQSAPGQVLDVARWSGDGRRLAVGIDRFDEQGFESGSAIAVVDLVAGTTTRITQFADFAYAPDWNRRTGEIVFSRETQQYAADPPSGPRDLFAIRPDGSGQRRLTSLSGNRMLWQPAVAPDGRSVVATLDEPGGRRGVRVDLASGRIERFATARVVMTHLKQRP